MHAAVLAAFLLATAPDSGPRVVRADWRARVREFAQQHLQHPAWGVAHAERDYRVALLLAHADGVALDTDVVYAAAWLHDMGAFAEFAAEGVDHGDRAAVLVGDVLTSAGFPMEKLDAVRDAIAHHMYYHEVGATPEARYLRDADTLDFLGAIGATRILAIVGRHRWAPDVPGAIATIRRHLHELPPTLRSPAARREGAHRARELERWLRELDGESSGGASL